MSFKIRSALCLAALSFLFACSSPAETKEHGLSDALMDQALTGLEHIIGSDISKRNAAWLRRQWAEDFVHRPDAYIEWLESIALAQKLTEDGIDPLALARIRNRVIDQLYCRSLQTSDPVTHRSRSFVATPELVLAADCVADAVVTTFDLEALAESNARVGELLGSPVSANRVESELRSALRDGIEKINPEGRLRLLSGEFRAKALEVFLAEADETTRDAFIEAAHQTFTETSDVATAALVLEKKALAELNNVAAIAREGEFRFGPAALANLVAFIEFVTGAKTSPGERAEITAILVSNFHDNPQRTLDSAANLRQWLDRGYHFGKDPNTGATRTWTDEEKVQMRRTEAAVLYCSNYRGDADDKRFIEILFAHDPVTSADCEATTIVRRSQQVVATDGEFQFTRGALDAHRRAFEVIYDIRFTPPERRWFDDASIADVERGRVGLAKALDDFQRIANDISKHAATGPHMNEQWREDYAIRIHCVNADTNDKDTARLFDTISAHDPIVHEDCERSAVIRNSDIEGRVASMNFIGALAGREPLTEAQRKVLLKGIKTHFGSFSGGPLNYRSESVKFAHWWSRMPLPIRRKNAATLTEKVASLQSLFDMRPTLTTTATTQLGLQSLCDMQISRLKHETKMVELRSPAIFNPNPNYNGSPLLNPEAAFNAIEFYGVMAPFVRQQCERVWK